MLYEYTILKSSLQNDHKQGAGSNTIPGTCTEKNQECLLIKDDWYSSRDLCKTSTRIYRKETNELSGDAIPLK